MTKSRKLLILLAVLAFSSVQMTSVYAGEGCAASKDKASTISGNSAATVKTADATGNTATKSCAATCSVADKQACASKMAATGSGQLTHLTIGVAYLSCNGCAGKVSSALKEVKGVQSVAVDYRSGLADVEFDASSVGSVELISAIEKAGYHAQVGPYSETELSEFAKSTNPAPVKAETSKSCSGGN